MSRAQYVGAFDRYFFILKILLQLGIEITSVFFVAKVYLGTQTTEDLESALTYTFHIIGGPKSVHRLTTNN